MAVRVFICVFKKTRLCLFYLSTVNYHFCVITIYLNYQYEHPHNLQLMQVRNLSLYTQTSTKLGMHVTHTIQAHIIYSLCTSIDRKMPELTWTTEMERALLQSMVEQVRGGKRAESGFNKEAWVISVDQVKGVAKLPDLVTMKKAKDKLDTLKTK